MAEELQGILERIQKNGIEKAENEASRIIDEAKAQAAKITATAKKEAEDLVSKARTDSELFQQRAEHAIEHAARDVVLSVGDAVTATLQGIVANSVKSTFKAQDFAAFVKKTVSTYCQQTSPGNIEAVTNYFMKEMAEQMKQGLTIKGDRDIISGFTVSLKDKAVYHDFTGTALTDALCALLRPQLAEIIKKAAAQKDNTNS